MNIRRGVGNRQRASTFFFFFVYQSHVSIEQNLCTRGCTPYGIRALKYLVIHPLHFVTEWCISFWFTEPAIGLGEQSHFPNTSEASRQCGMYSLGPKNAKSKGV